ncbi:MAG TPA: hypothetical protein VF627_05565 [Abditibacterium sp.]|jgi:hypothetical protein
MVLGPLWTPYTPVTFAIENKNFGYEVALTRRLEYLKNSRPRSVCDSSDAVSLPAAEANATRISRHAYRSRH